MGKRARARGQGTSCVMGAPAPGSKRRVKVRVPPVGWAVVATTAGVTLGSVLELKAGRQPSWLTWTAVGINAAHAVEGCLMAATSVSCMDIRDALSWGLATFLVGYPQWEARRLALKTAKGS